MSQPESPVSTSLQVVNVPTDFDNGFAQGTDRLEGNTEELSENGVKILLRAVLVHAPETPETHKPTVTKGNSSGRLIHAASGSCGALGGFLKRPGWAR